MLFPAALVLIFGTTATTLVLASSSSSPQGSKRKYVAERYAASSLSSSASRCLFDAVTLAHGQGYHVRAENCTDALTAETIVQRMANNITYLSPNNARAILPYSLLRSPAWDDNATSTTARCRGAFDGVEFLNLLRGGVLVVLGDSIVRQVYEALEVELMPHQAPVLRNVGPFLTHGSYNGNGTHAGNEGSSFALRDGVPLVDVLGGYVHRSKRRYYPAYNASLYWCESPRPVAPSSDPQVPVDNDWVFCVRHMVDVLSRARPAYLVIGVGAWYKPDPESPTDYNTELHASAAGLAAKAGAFRRYVETSLPDVHVLWRLQPHAFPYDDWMAAAKGNATMLTALGGRHRCAVPCAVRGAVLRELTSPSLCVCSPLCSPVTSPNGRATLTTRPNGSGRSTPPCAQSPGRTATWSWTTTPSPRSTSDTFTV